MQASVLFIQFFVFSFWSLLATKLQKYYVIFVYILQGKMGKMEKSRKKIMQLRWRKYQKPKDENMGRTKHISISVWSTNTYSSKIANTCAIRKKSQGNLLNEEKNIGFSYEMSIFSSFPLIKFSKIGQFLFCLWREMRLKKRPMTFMIKFNFDNFIQSEKWTF